MKRWILSLLLCGLLVLGLAACDSGGGSGGSAADLVGSWTITESTDPTDVGAPVVFNADGTSLWNGFPLMWNYTGGNLTLSFVDEAETVQLVWLNENKVQITDPADGVAFIMVRN